VTVDAQIGLLHHRGVISPVIEPAGSLQNASRAIVDAVAAPLAPILYDINRSPGDDDVFGIEGNSPEFHLLTSANVMGVAIESFFYRLIPWVSQDK
jgi:hypothetical protein